MNQIGGIMRNQRLKVSSNSTDVPPGVGTSYQRTLSRWNDIMKTTIVSCLNTFVSLIAVLLISSACSFNFTESDFFELPSNELEQKFSEYPLEEQFRLFRYGNDKLEPPYVELADPIAKRGNEAVPFLLTKLESETDELGIRDIVLIFEMMAYYKSYNVNEDQRLMSLVSSKIATMTTWKSVTMKMLDRIIGIREGRKTQ